MTVEWGESRWVSASLGRVSLAAVGCTGQASLGFCIPVPVFVCVRVGTTLSLYSYLRRPLKGPGPSESVERQPTEWATLTIRRLGGTVNSARHVAFTRSNDEFNFKLFGYRLGD
jgi:hypothetical protein